MTARLKVVRAAFEQILAHAAAHAPEECCGILLGHGDTVIAAQLAANVAENPRTRFEIAPQTLIDAHRAARAGGLAVRGYFHSHPLGPPHPSATDRAEAAHDGAIWAIAALGDVTFWRDDEFAFTPLSYVVVER